jgi:outer membrane receptor protein involved in Fe transport
MRGALRTQRAFARFDYDLTNNIHFYVDGIGAINTSAYQNQSLGYNAVVLSARNAFLPASIQAQMPATSTFTFSKIPMQLGSHRSVFRLKDSQISAGLDGEFGDGWKWNVEAAHGYALQNWRTLRNVNFQKLYAALDAVVNPANGQIVCSSTLTDPTANPGCVPLNPFGPTSESPEALAYITDFTQSFATMKLDEVNATITGAPFSTWAGPVNMALSGQLRRAAMSGESEVPVTDVQNCTGIRFNCNPETQRHQVTFRNQQLATQDVKEAALEADVPLLKDLPLAESFNANLALRYADYSTSGGALTWKVGADWHVTDELRLRATRSRDFRAPNLNDLYMATSVSHANVADQLTGATLLNASISSGGNPNLKPENGDTLTGGFIYRPTWLPGASLSVDGYRIKITDALANQNGSNVTVQRICNASGGTSPLCSQIVRPLPYTNTTTANNATFFYSTPINAAYIQSHGADIEANYATQLFDHAFSLRVLTTWQPELRTVIPGISDLDSSGAATPEWRLTGTLNYNVTDELRVTLTERWRSAVWWNSDRTFVYDMPEVPAFYWTNMNVNWSPKWKTETELYVNVQNLFDQQAPYYTTSMTNPGVIGAYFPTDDYIGRYYTVGVRLKF